MKQIWKKLICWSLLVACAFSLMACGSSTAEETDTVDAEMSSTLAAQSQSLVETIVALSDEDIENYKNSGDEFTESAMDIWETNKDDLGEYVECANAEVTADGEEFIVVVPASFKKLNSNFTFVYDQTGVPTSMAIDINKTMAMKLEQAGLNTVMGIGIVFIMLIFLSFIISLFKHISKFENMLKNKKETGAAAPAAAPAVTQNLLVNEVPESNNEELIAVIAAAIAAAEGTSTDAFVVRSIKKSKRNRW